MGKLRPKTWPQRPGSVREDWLAWLPAEKEGLFEQTVNQLDVFYWMLSVTLDESFSLRSNGMLVHAQTQAGICADLFDRLAAGLVSVLRALEGHGRHFGTLPNVAPLNAESFRSDRVQRMAKKSSLLQKVLFSSRSKFFHKLHALTETVEDLQGEFREVAEEIADGASIHPGASWEALDVLHYDLNTCLREAIVMLKSFLCALPNDEVPAFRQKLQAYEHLLPLKSLARVTRGSP